MITFEQAIEKVEKIAGDLQITRANYHEVVNKIYPVGSGNLDIWGLVMDLSSEEKNKLRELLLEIPEAIEGRKSDQYETHDSYKDCAVRAILTRQLFDAELVFVKAWIIERFSSCVFCGIVPTGFIYCDKENLVDGDYKRLAYQSFETLEVKLESDCPAHFRYLVNLIAETNSARKGEEYTISESGQTVKLGAKA